MTKARHRVEPNTALAVTGVLPSLRDALATRGAAVLTAPPGSGKTTAIPIALLDEAWLAGRAILMTEPRRLAARAAARFMASTLSEPVGERIGYRVRHESKVGPHTRIELVTEGVLVRRIQADPALEGVGLVIFDEFHERNVETDLALALLLDARTALRDDLRVLVMSATLDEAPIAALLGDAPIIRADGRLHPVDVVHLPAPARSELIPAVARTVNRALADGPGDVLVFLPGVGEIRDAARLIERLAPSPSVYPLHGNLSAPEQDRAVRPDPEGIRRVVIATNIAESSLTIEGVGAVVDAGFARAPRFDPTTGLTRLETLRISRAEADQRAGRAGRLGPGRCYRLWSNEQHARLADARTPALRIADLAPVLLEVALWGATDPLMLDWLDPPPDAAIAQARALLEALGALDEPGRTTERGRAMASIPAHPRLGAMIVSARTPAETALACDLAALIEARDPLARDDAGADIVERLRGLERGTGAFAGVARDARAMRRRLRVGNERPAPPEAAGALLCAAYPDRLAERRGGPSERTRYRLANGRGARLLEGDPLGRASFLVVANLQVREGDGVIRLAASVSRGALESALEHCIRTVETIEFDPRESCVVAAVERRIGSVVLERTENERPDPDRLVTAMLDGVRRMGLDALAWSERARGLQARAAAVREWHPDESWPDLSDAALGTSIEDWLAPWLAGITRRAHLERLDVAAMLEARLDRDQRRRLDRLAPTHLTLPGGRRVRLDWQVEAPPALALRAQDLYGQTTTPAVDEGRRPVSITLLSPAGRPIQRTRDLAGFWAGSWADVRKDMRARYPKHDWPEDPASASPRSSRPSRRR